MSKIIDLPNPAMPEVTPANAGAGSIAALLLGYAFTTNNDTLALACIIGAVVLGVAVQAGDTVQRWARNKRISDVQTQAIHSANETATEEDAADEDESYELVTNA